MQPEVLAWALAQTAGTQARSLADAYVAGEKSVRFADGRAVEYREVAAMERALASLYAAQNSAARRPARTVAVVGDGFR